MKVLSRTVVDGRSISRLRQRHVPYREDGGASQKFWKETLKASPHLRREHKHKHKRKGW